MCTEEEYAYTAKDGKCAEEKCTLDVGVTGRVNIPEGDLDSLLAAAEKTPIAIAVDASSWSFYSGGIMKSKKTSLNHGVQLDGFHIESDDEEYLLVRNSWGSRWGESGFIRLDTEQNSGATLAASYPTFDTLEVLENDKCDDGKDADPSVNCMCTYGVSCSEKKPCKEECGCGEFGFCR